MDLKSNASCEVCYFEYGIDLEQLIIKPCSHLICIECVKSYILVKGVCPFCKQKVSDLIRDQNVQISLCELRKQYPLKIEFKQENFEDAQLQFLQHEFFIDDVNTLAIMLKETYNRLRSTISQKDLDFERKWQIYDNVEIEIGQLSKVIKDRQQMDPVEIINKIPDLMQVIEDIKLGRWGSSRLDKYHEKQKIKIDNLESNFFIKKAKGKKKNQQNR